MKKFLLFLTLLVSAIGLTHAKEVTISSNFTDSKLSVVDGELGWTASITANSFETASPSRGVQFGAAKGKFTMTSAKEISNFKTISLVISSNATGNEITSITVGGTEILSSTPQGIAKDNNKTVEYKYTGDTNISGTIVISFNDVNKSIYVKSITVTYDDAGTGGGEVSKDCGISFSSDSENVDYPGTEYKLPFNNEHNVTVTFSSSDAKVASVDENTGAVTINGCGTTTITASFAGDANYNGKAVSFDLTVNKIATSISFEKASYTVNPGDSFTAPTPTLTGIPAGATLSWESSNTGVATVDAGNVTLGETTGTTTITASYAGDDTHAAATASYSLTVIDQSSGEIVIKSSDLPTSGDLTTHTINGATLEFVQNGSSNITAGGSTYFRFYAKNILNISIAESLVITKIVFTGTSGYINNTKIAPNSDNATVTASGTTATWSLKSNETATNFVSIINKDTAQARISKIVIYYETKSTKDNPGLAFDETEVTKLVGAENFTNPLTKPNDLTVTYTTEPAESTVATVNASTGEVTVLGIGTVTIVASSAETETYKAGSASYTLTVNRAEIAYLVTDASVLQPGDIVIIANQEDAVAFATKKSSSTSGAKSPTAITLSNYNAEIISISNNVMLFEVGNDVSSEKTYYTFRTTNYLGTDGYIGNDETSNGCYVDATITARNRATVNINAKTGEATIIFNEGNTDQNTYLTYNASSPGYFNCYAEGKQKPVYIYKLVDKPATVDAEVSGSSFLAKVNKDDNNVVELETMFLTSTSYNKVAIYMENVLVGTYDVNSSTGEVNASFDHVPYLPSAKFTMRPVLKEESGIPTQFGPAEALNFEWLDINSYGLVELDPSLVWIGSDADPLPATATLGANCNFGIDIPKAVANLNYYVEVEAKNESTGEAYEGEFSWTELGFCYSITPYITGVPVDTKNKSLELDKYTGEFPTITCYVTPIYKFDVAEQYRSLLTPATPRPARVASTITDGVQTVVCDVKDAQVTFSATTAVSGVEGVTVDGGAAVEYFNLQGVRVDGDLAPGIYIRRQGQSVSKVQIR